MFRCFARVLRAAVFFGAALALAQAAAADDPQAPLSLREAVRLALERNPDLQTFAFELRAQDARAQQAALRPAPALSVDLEHAFGTGNFKGTGAAETTFALSQVIELGGKRGRRTALAGLGRETVTVEHRHRRRGAAPAGDGRDWRDHQRHAVKSAGAAGAVSHVPSTVGAGLTVPDRGQINP